MEKKTVNSLTIHNIKSNGYRQVHVDGAHGGLTPKGLINLSFYSERGVIPKGTNFEVTKEGNLEAKNDTDDSLTGLAREFEFGIYMDINTTISLNEFLSKKIEEYNILNKNKSNV